MGPSAKIKLFHFRLYNRRSTERAGRFLLNFENCFWKPECDADPPRESLLP